MANFEILWVEDKPRTIQHVINLVQDSLPVHFVKASNASMALEKIMEYYNRNGRPFDAVIVDIKMPFGMVNKLQKYQKIIHREYEKRANGMFGPYGLALVEMLAKAPDTFPWFREQAKRPFVQCSEDAYLHAQAKALTSLNFELLPKDETINEEKSLEFFTTFLAKLGNGTAASEKEESGPEQPVSAVALFPEMYQQQIHDHKSLFKDIELTFQNIREFLGPKLFESRFDRQAENVDEAFYKKLTPLVASLQNLLKSLKKKQLSPENMKRLDSLEREVESLKDTHRERLEIAALAPEPVQNILNWMKGNEGMKSINNAEVWWEKVLQNGEDFLRLELVYRIDRTLRELHDFRASTRNLLNYLDSGKESIEKKSVFDLGKLYNNTIEQVRAFADTHSVEVRSIPYSVLQRGFKVKGYKAEMITAIQNLLENGVKYSNPLSGKDPWVVCRIKTTGGYVVLDIESWGIGITREEIAQRKIFKARYRGDMAKSVSTGSGLGLAKAEAIVIKHAGKIEVTSELVSRFRQGKQLNYKNIFSVYIPIWREV